MSRKRENCAKFDEHGRLERAIFYYKPDYTEEQYTFYTTIVHVFCFFIAVYCPAYDQKSDYLH